MFDRFNDGKTRTKSAPVFVGSGRFRREEGIFFLAPLVALAAPVAAGAATAAPVVAGAAATAAPVVAGAAATAAPVVAGAAAPVAAGAAPVAAGAVPAAGLGATQGSIIAQVNALNAPGALGAGTAQGVGALNSAITGTAGPVAAGAGQASTLESVIDILTKLGFAANFNQQTGFSASVNPGAASQQQGFANLLKGLRGGAGAGKRGPTKPATQVRTLGGGGGNTFSSILGPSGGRSGGLNLSQPVGSFSQFMGTGGASAGGSRGR